MSKLRRQRQREARHYRVGQRVRIVSPRSVFRGKVYPVTFVTIDRLGVQYYLNGAWYNAADVEAA